jgi:signal transduction histidine kinase
VTPALAACGWAAVAALAVAVAVLRRRLELVARAEHELHGPATVLCLAVERMGREPSARGHARALELEIERLRAGLADLAAARTGGRARQRPGPVPLARIVEGAAAAWAPSLSAAGRDVRVDWRAGDVAVRADRGRVAQVLGNLLANAVEHGGGPVELSGRRVPGGVRVEVRNGGRRPRRAARAAGRGRGLAVATAAAEATGGRLDIRSREEATVAALELPTATVMEEPSAETASERKPGQTATAVSQVDMRELPPAA